MENLISGFFKDFGRENKKEIVWASFWRLVACLQALFWPFAFAKVVNIMSEDPASWRRALLWVGALVANKALEDFIRLRSKYRLQTIIIKLKTELASFFTEETALKDGTRTGEAVQDVKRVTETTAGLASYYKNNFLQLPVNLVVIPFVLFRADVKYFIFIVAYTIFYLVLDYFWAGIYSESQEDTIKAGEEFWGATYRKAPDVWRGREDQESFTRLIRNKARTYSNRSVETQNIHYWRWTSVQILSSLSRGAAVIFVLYRVIKGKTPVGDLVLVNSYFARSQGSLNILTNTVRKIIDWRAALRELKEAVRREKPPERG